MANTLFDGARKRFLEADIHWLNDTIKVMLVSTASYTANFGTHQFLSDIPPSSRIGSAVTLTGKSTDGGAADANDVTFSSVSGARVDSVVLYKDTGVEGTSPVMVWIDTATGLPITPNGGDIICTWDNGVNRIFRL